MSYRFQNPKYFLLASVFFCTMVYFVYVYTSYAQPVYFRTKIKGIPNISTISVTQNEDWESARIKVALWVSQDNKPSVRTLERMLTVVDHWNSAKGQQCKIGDIQTIRSCKFEITTKHDIALQADAVVFYMLIAGYRLSHLPKQRRQDQVWVMYAREPPTLSGWHDPLKNIFNWTMSYRRDSDIWTPYGRMFLKNSTYDSKILMGSNSNIFLSKWISGKDKLVAVVMSRCQSNSKREFLMLKMMEAGIKIDTYGECGNSSICGRYEKNCSGFWNNLAKHYKFYLAFENSLCQDYITEKFWRALNLGIVPIVYGGGDYAVEAPPGSYIDVRDFSTVRKLKRHLKILNENDEKYAEYFEWRGIYSAGVTSWVNHEGCLLCKQIYEEKYLKGNKKNREGMQYYSSLRYWWQHRTDSVESACTNKPIWGLEGIFKEYDSNKYENI